MISLKNENIAEIAEFKLNKQENNFTEQELCQITDIVYDVLTLDDETIEDDLEDLKYFKNLKKLYLMNMRIEKKESKNIFILPSIEDLTFDRVIFEYTDFIEALKLKKVSFINTNIEDFSFINKMPILENIEIIGASKVDSTIFKNLENLKKLTLSYSTIENVDELEKMKNLESIGIDNTNIVDLKFLKEWENLKMISLNQQQINENINIVRKLKEKDVRIFIDDCVEY